MKLDKGDVVKIYNVENEYNGPASEPPFSTKYTFLEMGFFQEYSIEADTGDGLWSVAIYINEEGLVKTCPVECVRVENAS